MTFILDDSLSDLSEIRIKLHDKFVSIVVNFRLSGKSLTYNRSDSGPRMDP